MSEPLVDRHVCALGSSVMACASERGDIRRAGRDARQAVRGTERVALEELLVGHLRALDALKSPCIGLFVAHDGEPDITALAELLWQRDQVVALPVVDDTADGLMHFRSWRPDVVLSVGRYGIAAPPLEQSEPVEPTTLLVSLTAFDARGQRMGRGGGYFDRYLSSATCTTVGVAFESQRVAAVPTAPHDVAMQIMVTDLGVRFIA